MTTKLIQLSKACRALGQERPLTETDDTQSVRELNASWDESIRLALETANWLWAIRTVQIFPDPGINTTAFGGRKYGYTLPPDFVRVAFISSSPYFTPNSGFDDYDIQGPGRTLYADLNPLYIKYVSSDASYGQNLAVWPETFAEGHGFDLARISSLPITKDKGDRQELQALADGNYARAKVRDALNEPMRSQPTGRLVRARLGGFWGRSNGPLWPI